MEELKMKILAWANERGLLKTKNKYVQLVKLGEELYEYNSAKTVNEKIDAIGDCYVVLTIFSHQIKHNNLYPIRLYTQDNASWLYLKMTANINKEGIYFLCNLFAGVLDAIAAEEGLTLQECVQKSYNEIKDRKGKTINGNFIKN